MTIHASRAITRTALVIGLGVTVLLAAALLQLLGPGYWPWRLWGKGVLLWLFGTAYLPLATRFLIGRRRLALPIFYRRLTRIGVLLLLAGGCLSAVGIVLHLADYRIGLALIVVHVFAAVPAVGCLAAGLYESRFWRRPAPAEGRGEEQ